MSPDPIAPPTPAYFVSYPDLVRRAKAMAVKYPDLVTVRDIGDSSETRAGTAKRDILAIELTNKRVTGAKPVVEYLGGVHANEIANPALLLDWADGLLASFGMDTAATALLDTRDISLVPMVNPDGNARVAHAMKTGGPLGEWYGGRVNGEAPLPVDINRNFDFHWGQGGSSPTPDGGNYRGAFPGSEAETQAVQAYTALRRPSLFIDWHSYSGLVLRPMGDTNAPAKDEAGLKAVGDRFARLNGYTSERSFELYPTSGTTDGWAYGALGIPAYCIETGIPTPGDEENGHLTVTTPEGYDTIRRANNPVLWDAATIGDKPYERVVGPMNQGWASLDAHTFGAIAFSENGTRIKRSELVFDPRVPEGRGITLTADDGAFNSSQEQVSGRLPKNAAARAHDDLVYVRSQDTKGRWGVASPVFLHEDPADRKVTARQS